MKTQKMRSMLIGGVTAVINASAAGRDRDARTETASARSTPAATASSER